MLYKKIIFLCVLVCLSLNTYAQTKKITGKITELNGTAVQGATISLKGSPISTLSQTDGNYSITIPEKGNNVLVFSFVGYASQEVVIRNQKTINVNFQTQVNDLDEVVVVGYGTQKKRDLTGAVAKVDMGDVLKAPVRSFEEALGGRVAGVQVTSTDGQPGSPTSIVIRGNNSLTQDNSPLWVVDGFPLENPNNNSINPADIESLEVLKDASATAIYGARAANGVIMVTTKKGRVGKTVFNFNSSYGAQDIIQKVKVLSAYEFIRFQNENDPTNTKSRYFSNGETVDSYKNIAGTDWQDAVLQAKAPIVSNTLSMSGGNAATKYYVSLSAFNQNGIVKYSGYNRYQGRFRLDQTVNSKVKVGLNINYSSLKSYGTIPSNISGSSQTSNLMYSVWGYRPVFGSAVITDLMTSDPLFEGDPNDGRFNPVETITYELRDRFSNTLYGNLSLDYKINNDFAFKSMIGYTNDQDRNEEFNNSNTRSGSPSTVSGRANGVNGSFIYNTANSYVIENTLSFNKKIGKNNIDAIGGFTMQEASRFIYGASAAQLPNERLGLSGLDEGIPSKISSSKTKNTLASAIARVNYSYEGKYLASLSFRADGSSKFTPENKWGYFPSASIAWRFSEEKFMEDINIISDAKIRLSHGIIGNNRVSDFAYLSTLNSPIVQAYPFNGTLSSSTVPYTLGNPNLKWESTQQTDLGLDLSLFKKKLSLAIDLYKKNTTDLLLYADLPTSSGFARAYKNIGEVENKGIELTLSANLISKNKFNWNSSFNIAFNDNKIVSLNGGQEALLTTINWDNQWNSTPAYIAKVGQPIGQFVGYIWDGLYQIKDFNVSPAGAYVLKSNITSNTANSSNNGRIQPGYIKYKDLNGDLIINDDDKAVIGNAAPLFTGGFTNNIKFGNFDLNIFFQYSYGGQVLNANRLVFEGNSGRTLQNQFESVLNRWTIDNQNNEMFVAKGSGDKVYSSRVIEDGSYVRLKTMQLGYNLNSKMIKRLKLQSCRFYVSGQNIVTWTNYTGYDPEVSAYNSALTPGFDYSVYPRAKTITLGLNVNF